METLHCFLKLSQANQGCSPSCPDVTLWAWPWRCWVWRPLWRQGGPGTDVDALYYKDLALESSSPAKASVLGFIPDPAELYKSWTYAHGPQRSCAQWCQQVWGGTPKTDAKTSLWCKVQSSGATQSLQGTPVTSSGTTGSSKTTDRGLITRTCAFEPCLQTRWEVKGYDMSESRSPHTDTPSVQSEHSWALHLLHGAQILVTAASHCPVQPLDPLEGGQDSKGLTHQDPKSLRPEITIRSTKPKVSALSACKVTVTASTAGKQDRSIYCPSLSCRQSLPENSLPFPGLKHL